MTTYNFFRNKYKAILYQTPMGQLITELIKENFDKLERILKPISCGRSNVAQEALVAMIWGCGMAQEGERVHLDPVAGLGEKDSTKTFNCIDIWLEQLLHNYAVDVKDGLKK